MRYNRHPDTTRTKVLSMYKSGATLQEIAMRTGVSESTVRAWRHAAGLPLRGQGFRLRPASKTRGQTMHSADERAAALKLYADGLSSAEVSARTGIAATTVTYWARADGVVPPRRKRHRYPPETIAAAMKLYAAGEPMLRIEAATGADRHTIRQWANNDGMRPRRGNHMQSRKR